MATVIKATSMCMGKRVGDSSIELAARAAKDCIEKSSVNMHDIEVLINVGVCRDKNIIEPAMASLIQQKVGLNLDPTEECIEAGKGTFSFDVLNGSCGFLTAAKVVDALIRNGRIDTALITASDVHPSGKQMPDFPFTHSGAAILMGRENSGENGFKKIMIETSKSGGIGLKAYCDVSAHNNRARGAGRVDVEADYGERLQQFTLSMISEYIDLKVLNLSCIKLIIVSQPSPDFASSLSGLFGFDENSVLNVYERYGDTNSSAPIIGYHIATEENLIKESEKILIISGGAGLSAATGMYQV